MYTQLGLGKEYSVSQRQILRIVKNTSWIIQEVQKPTEE
jgi:hypothetical protein